MKLNHIALSVPHSALDPAGRKALVRFYDQVFGWKEQESFALPDRLMLQISKDQFLNVRGRDEAMQTTGYEHFGIAIDILEEFHEICERVRRYAEHDPEVEFRQAEPSIIGTAKLHVARVRYRIPMTVELQCFARVDAPA